MTNRLEILKNSLNKKRALFDEKLQNHFDTVSQSNGQPLNDKKNGRATLKKWESQNDSLRALNESIERTKRAIEKEEFKIKVVESFKVPVPIQELLNQGVLKQWRKHPRFFFVQGVEKARIVVNDNETIAARFVHQIPNQEQYAIFRDVFNGLRKEMEDESNGTRP